MQFRSLGRILIVTTSVTLNGCHPGGGIVHRVETGESLTQLAHVYDVPLLELLNANPRLISDTLKPGEKILVPGAVEKRIVAKPIWDMEEVRSERPEEEESGEEIVPEPDAAEIAVKPVSPPGTPRVEKKSRSVIVAPRKTVRFAWPGTGAVISKFGMRGQKVHNGIDMKVPPGSEIVSTADGKVVYVGDDVPGYGRLLIVRHPTNLFSVYAFVGEILSAKGTDVARGTPIARASRKPQEAFFHFELRKGKRAIDPLSILPR